MSLKIISTPWTISKNSNRNRNCSSLWFIDRQIQWGHSWLSKMSWNRPKNFSLYKQSGMEFYSVKRLWNCHDIIVLNQRQMESPCNLFKLDHSSSKYRTKSRSCRVNHQKKRWFFKKLSPVQKIRK